MKKNSLKVIALLVMSLFIMVGCGNNKKKDTATTTKQKDQTEKITIKDGSGDEIEVNKSPKKIIVFDMGSLDTIKALGGKANIIGAPVENIPAYLSEFKKVENVGGIKEPDLEKINELQPDLIIISGRQEDYKKDLSAIAPTIYLPVDGGNVWGSTQENITTLGKVLNKEEEAKDAISTLETNIAAVKKKNEASGEKALVTLVSEGELSAYGHGSRFGIVHDTFGFAQADNKIEASTHGQSVSYEYVLEKNPDVIFVIDRTKAIGGDDANNDVASNELVKETTAGKNDNVIVLQPDVWYLSGGGIESTQIMLDDVKRAMK